MSRADRTGTMFPVPEHAAGVPDEAAGASTIERRLLLLVHRLRRAGLPVSTTELVDACAVTMAIGVGNRDLWRVALRSALVKRADQLGVFDDLFDRLFPRTRPGRETLDDQHERASVPASPNSTASGASGPDAASRRGALSRRLLEAIAAGDLAMLRELAALAVDAHAALDLGGSSERQYLMRVTRAMDLANLLQQALRRAGGETSFAAQLAKADAAQMVEEFRKLLTREITQRLASLVPVETITTVKYPDDIAFLDTTAEQRSDLRRAIAPLARKLAARMAQRRRLRRTGRVDVRRTARHSLAYGGVPLEPVFKAKRASRPDLVVLCDVSGSVAEFANFVLSLVHALHEELERLRTFVFVDGVADVTQIFDDAQHQLAPMHLVTQPGVVRGEGHSDYGSVFEEFLRVQSSLLRPTTTLVITGDARSNYRDPHADALRKIAERVNAVYWLNPEPEQDWDTTDSIVSLYRPHCRNVFEVRTTRQLVAAVLEIDAVTR